MRLFIALHTCSASDLSNMVVHRPGPMKISQSLAGYAYQWVQYFINEANVNGVPYSKYRQYAYFVNGLHGRFSPIIKFLEQEFLPNHDRHNNIPISLELNNLPATIASLAKLHGIQLNIHGGEHKSIHKLSTKEDDVEQPGYGTVEELNNQLETVLQLNSAVSGRKHDTNHKAQELQCWLCDGNHSFRKCDQLQRLNSICAKRPKISKFVQNMLKKDGDKNMYHASINAILESYEEESNDDDSENIVHETLDLDIMPNIGLLSSLDFTAYDIPNEYDVPADMIHDVHDGFINCLRSDELQETKVLASKSDYVNSSAPLVRVPFEPQISQNQVNYSAKDNSKSLDITFRAQVDSGADRTTTPHLHLVHNLRKPNRSKGELTFIYDAGVHVHPIIGVGTFLLESFDPVTKQSQFLSVPCRCIPTIKSTLLNFLDSPDVTISIEYVDKSTGQCYRMVGLHDAMENNIVQHMVPLVNIHQRLYTHRLIPSKIHTPAHQLSYDSDTSHMVQHIVSDEPTRLLWHS